MGRLSRRTARATCELSAIKGRPRFETSILERVFFIALGRVGARCETRVVHAAPRPTWRLRCFHATRDNKSPEILANRRADKLGGTPTRSNRSRLLMFSGSTYATATRSFALRSVTDDGTTTSLPQLVRLRSNSGPIYRTRLHLETNSFAARRMWLRSVLYGHSMAGTIKARKVSIARLKHLRRLCKQNVPARRAGRFDGLVARALGRSKKR